MKKLIHECWMVFLPFGRNKGKGTYEMHSLCGEGISMMTCVTETWSNVPVSILMMASSKATEKKGRLNKEWWRTCFRKPIVFSNDEETSYRCCTWESTITPTWKDWSCRECAITVEESTSEKRSDRSPKKSSISVVCDSKNRAEMSGKKSSHGRPCVPYSAKVHESITMAKDEVSASNSRQMLSIMSPTSSIST